MAILAFSFLLNEEFITARFTYIWFWTIKTYAKILLLDWFDAFSLSDSAKCVPRTIFPTLSFRGSVLLFGGCKAKCSPNSRTFTCPKLVEHCSFDAKMREFQYYFENMSLNPLTNIFLPGVSILLRWLLALADPTFSHRAITRHAHNCICRFWSCPAESSLSWHY